MSEENLYLQRGVSSDKKRLKEIIVKLKKKSVLNVLDGTFCSGIKSLHFFADSSNLKDYFYFHHADGVGSKGSLAYLYYQETNSIKHFCDLIQDAWVMNTDDLLCVGGKNKLTFSTIITRNKNLISDDILQNLILGEKKMNDFFEKNNITVFNLGGETADMGEVIKTLGVEATSTTMVHKDNLINNRNIAPGQVIVGLSSFGQTTYEGKYNSGIGCNGLTSAKHDLLKKKYLISFPESCDSFTDNKYLYNGAFSLSDQLEGTPLNIGQALLSPARTYLPVMQKILERFSKGIKGIVHNSGGGQTKCLNFSQQIHFVKNNVYDFPPLFKLLSFKTSLKEMFKVYNCGHRLEIYTDEKTAKEIINHCANFELSARIVGYTLKNDSKKNKLTISYQDQKLTYES